MLAKQILAMNYIMPQTAALFDQLNNYGDQRYQSFQQGCNLDSLRQGAKDQYLKACVAKIQPDRKAMLKNGGAAPAAGGAAAATPPYLKDMTEAQIDSWAYAQAWEVCSNQYVSDTTILTMRKDMNEAFAKEVRRVENVTKAIVPLLCPYEKEGTEDMQEGCWAEMLIPQVRVCLEGSLECEGGENAYKITEPLLSMQRMFDAMRYIMDDAIIARRINPYLAELDKLDDNLVQRAGREAALSTSYGTLFRMEAGAAGMTDKTPFSNPTNVVPVNKSVRGFQLGYLNCKDPDIFLPVKALRDKIDIELKTGTKPVLNVLALSDYNAFVESMKLTDGDTTVLDNSKEAGKTMIDAVAAVMWSSMGCTANQSVPMFDANIMSSMSTQCSATDRYAFFTMAGYDVSMAATRDVYRYLNYRLKQTYSQLLTDARVPRPISSSVTTSPTINLELNNRLAAVVKDTMIPYVDAQLARLEEVQKSRGQFAQRVQQIYANKSGCVYGSVQGPKAPDRGSGRQ
ncbi:MAG: hypothetical protein EON60_05185 [Alphaproteobacteria bacterium]|nr:MAG: hypothetical protein EON60_05185 [Alphaproteobacteria bacterium]